jgi:hypothetical protein
MSSAVFKMSELERHVQERTGRRVRDLHVELEQERVVLQGKAGSYYVKQLAQSGVRDLLPEMTVENDIVVGAIT